MKKITLILFILPFCLDISFSQQIMKLKNGQSYEGKLISMVDTMVVFETTVND